MISGEVTLETEKTFGEFAHKKRRQRNITGLAMAMELGLSDGTLYGIEKGNNRIRLDTAIRLADYFGYEIVVRRKHGRDF